MPVAVLNKKLCLILFLLKQRAWVPQEKKAHFLPASSSLPVKGRAVFPHKWSWAMHPDLEFILFQACVCAPKQSSIHESLASWSPLARSQFVWDQMHFLVRFI